MHANRIELLPSKERDRPNMHLRGWFAWEIMFRHLNSFRASMGFQSTRGKNGGRAYWGVFGRHPYKLHMPFGSSCLGKIGGPMPKPKMYLIHHYYPSMPYIWRVPHRSLAIHAPYWVPLCVLLAALGDHQLAHMWPRNPTTHGLCSIAFPQSQTACEGRILNSKYY